jgi:hypothetical protein
MTFSSPLLDELSSAEFSVDSAVSLGGIYDRYTPGAQPSPSSLGFSKISNLRGISVLIWVVKEV